MKSITITADILEDPDTEIRCDVESYGLSLDEVEVLLTRFRDYLTSRLEADEPLKCTSINGMHDFVSADNEYVTGASVCVHCKAIVATSDVAQLEQKIVEAAGIKP
jgi:hypothetical protein